MSEVSTFPVVAKPHPLRSESVVAYMREGMTLREALGDHPAYSLMVKVGGVEVAERLWDQVRPRAGVPVHVQVYPQGGNAGKYLRTILLVVVAIVAWEIAPYLTGEFGLFAGANTALVAAGLSMVGSLSGQALTP